MPRVLVLELWGVGDLALAIPFLRTAAAHAEVTLVAKPHAAPILRRFVPSVSLVALEAPWTAFSAKYRLHRWPWRTLGRTVGALRRSRFDAGVSARPDPRDHALLVAAGTHRRVGFPRGGSRLLLSDALPRPADPHRSSHWAAVAASLGWTIDPQTAQARPGTDPARRHFVIHTGAGHPVKQWPRARFEAVAGRLRDTGCAVTLLDDSLRDLDRLMDLLAGATHFIGNDSGPGHLAALLGVPTFTVFGDQFASAFAPRHPGAAWIEGAPCPHKPCYDSCRFAEPRCLLATEVDAAWERIAAWSGLEPRPASFSHGHGT